MIEEVRQLTGYDEALQAARLTVNKPPTGKEPSHNWVQSVLMAEHSPIRNVMFWVKWRIPKWVSTHFVRHGIGITHFVSTSREDRTGVSREEKEKSVFHGATLNAQAIINISRKRLCFNASEETRKAWVEFLLELQKQGHSELYEACVPECVYRGFCPEFKSCGYYGTGGVEQRKRYLRGFEDRRIREEP